MSFQKNKISLDNQKNCVIIFLKTLKGANKMKLPDEIYEIGKNLTINDFDACGYAYSGHTTNEEVKTETIYFLPLDLKNREIVMLEVPFGFCEKFAQQLKMGLKRSAPLILAASLNIDDLDKIPLQLFASSDFTKCCLTLMNNSMAIMSKQSTEVLQFKPEIKRTAEWRNRLRLKLRDKMTQAKKQYLEK